MIPFNWTKELAEGKPRFGLTMPREQKILALKGPTNSSHGCKPVGENLSVTENVRP
jgi:hypothetical protein